MATFNNMTLLTMAFMLSNIMYASENVVESRANLVALDKAESTCSPELYKRVMAYKFRTSTMNASLAHLVGGDHGCIRSGNLKSLVEINLAHGGNALDEQSFKSMQMDASCFLGFDSTALGQLVRHTHEIPQDKIGDIQATVETLVRHGASIDTGLLEACYYKNMLMAKILLRLGASSVKQVKVEGHPFSKSKLFMLDPNERFFEGFRTPGHICAGLIMPSIVDITDVKTKEQKTSYFAKIHDWINRKRNS